MVKTNQFSKRPKSVIFLAILLTWVMISMFTLLGDGKSFDYLILEEFSIAWLSVFLYSVFVIMGLLTIFSIWKRKTFGLWTSVIALSSTVIHDILVFILSVLNRNVFNEAIYYNLMGSGKDVSDQMLNFYFSDFGFILSFVFVFVIDILILILIYKSRHFFKVRNT